MTYKVTGVILNKKNWGEYDRLFILYTLELGKLAVVGPSVRRVTSKLAGNLETFVLANFTLAKGASARSSSDS